MRFEVSGSKREDHQYIFPTTLPGLPGDRQTLGAADLPGVCEKAGAGPAAGLFIVRKGTGT